MSKRLTVAIPNYNGGEKLERAVRSCSNLEMDAEEFEILVVDNCSEDNSVHIVENLQDEHSNLRLKVNEENLGRIGNWNRCIEEAKGEFLMLLFVREQIAPGNNVSELISKLENSDVRMAVTEQRHLSTFDENQGGEFERSNVRKKLRYELLSKGLPDFGPIQCWIIEKELLDSLDHAFKSEYPIVGDQDFMVRLVREMGENGIQDKFLRTDRIGILWDDTVDRFAKSVTPVEAYEEMLDWYRFEEIHQFTLIPTDLIRIARVSKIENHQFLSKVSGGKYFNDGLVASDFEESLSMRLISFFYPLSWISTIWEIIKEINAKITVPHFC
jgi:glycosyltransferase involved in cell wall biosynthesis